MNLFLPPLTVIPETDTVPLKHHFGKNENCWCSTPLPLSSYKTKYALILVIIYLMSQSYKKDCFTIRAIMHKYNIMRILLFFIMTILFNAIDLVLDEYPSVCPK